MSDYFDLFWQVYPRKVAKKKARAVFNKIGPSPKLLRKMINAVEQQKGTEQWQKNKGQYIPHPATWLNQDRWNDKIDTEIRESKKLTEQEIKENTGL